LRHAQVKARHKAGVSPRSGSASYETDATMTGRHEAPSEPMNGFLRVDFRPGRTRRLSFKPVISTKGALASASTINQTTLSVLDMTGNIRNPGGGRLASQSTDDNRRSLRPFRAAFDATQSDVDGERP